MRKGIIGLLFIYWVNVSGAQSITGQWRTIDEDTGLAKSIIEIYETDGKYFGKIIDIINPKRKNPLCEKCEGENKNKPIKGLVIINDMVLDNDIYEAGTILDPRSGKEYKCHLKIEEDKNKLEVRGYIAFFYRTQYWERVR